MSLKPLMDEAPQQLPVTVNGQPDFVLAGETVAELLIQRKIPAKGCAVAVNAEVVPHMLWSATVIHENDKIEVLTATAGG